MMKEYKLSCNQHEIAVYENGNGNFPIVLLHGGGLDSAMLSWREVIAAMPQRYTVYAIDLLGYGQSDSPDDMMGETFYSRHIAAVACVVDQLHLGRFILSGLSMGGAIAIGYTLLHQERVAALIPVDSWGLVSRMPMNGLYYWCVHTSLLDATCRLLARHRSLVRWSLSYSLFGDRANVTDALVDEIITLCSRPGAGKAMVDYQRSSLTRHSAIPDYTHSLETLTMPVLFISGEKDALVRVRDVASASQVVPHGTLHVMKGCKHWSQKERPEEYVRVVDEFIQTSFPGATL